jgi:hypothetical protein
MTRSEITFWVFIALALFLSYFVLAATAGRANATEWDWSLHSNRYHQPKKRVVRKKRHRPEVRYYAPPRAEFDREDRFCLGPVRGVGTQWIGEDGALTAARKDWMERVRYDLGESFIDLTHAVDFEKRCGRTSIGETLGQILYRCEVVARPCKAEFSQGEAGK